MIRMIVTGGQSGADQAGWRAAKEMRIPTGGYMPRGYMTEDGPKPEFKDEYNAIETEYEDYPSRTEANIKISDIVLWFGNESSPGGKLTKRLAGYKGIQFETIPLDIKKPFAFIFAAALRLSLVGTRRRVMIAGNRESSHKGIGSKVETLCLELFRAYNNLENRR